MSTHIDDDIQDRLNINLSNYQDPEERSAAEAAALSQAVKQIIEQSCDMEKSKAAFLRKFAVACGAGLAVAVVIIIAQAAAITTMLPLKETVTLPVLIDRNTGFVEARDPRNEKLPPIPVLVDQAQVASYVIARESYDWHYADNNYKKVKAMSADNIFPAYDKFITSKRSPLEVLGKNYIIMPRIIATTQMDESTIQYRVVKDVIGLDGTISAVIKPTNWIVTVKYELPENLDKAQKELTLEQRLLNPLAYTITYYNPVQESTAH